MLAEIFILRLEVILRSNALASTRSEIRFVPIKPPTSPVSGRLVRFFFAVFFAIAQKLERAQRAIS